MVCPRATGGARERRLRGGARRDSRRAWVLAAPLNLGAGRRPAPERPDRPTRQDRSPAAYGSSPSSSWASGSGGRHTMRSTVAILAWITSHTGVNDAFWNARREAWL